MNRKFVMTVCFIAAFFISQAQTLDAGYKQKFGDGVVLVSGKGFPQMTKFDESQFNFKDGKFFLEPGSETTADFRAILPAGTTVSTYMNKVKTERGQNISYKTAEFVVWEIYCSHDGGTDQLGDRYSWPKGKSEVPGWAEPCVNVFQKYEPTNNGTWNTIGLGWAYESGNMQFEFGTRLHMATPGHKFYVIFRVAYEYSVPGGQTENKWNSEKQIFEPTVSSGGVGYVYSDPIAVATIEMEGYANATGRFTNNNNGTTTDSKTGRMWVQSPTTQGMSYDDAVKYAESFEVGGHNDWRLPTLAEMEDLMKCSKAMDAQYENKWLNENGFNDVQSSSYWTTDEYLRDGSPTGERMTVDFTYKITGSDDPLRFNNVWLVR